MVVAFSICNLFDDTLKIHGRTVAETFSNFINAKSANPLAAFGSKDYPFTNGILSKHNPKLMHSGMTQNISLVYTIQGSNPNIISLYGFFTHAETGTSRPQSAAKQKSFMKRVSKQNTWRNF